MFTNLFSALSAWIATPTGTASVAVFFTIGLVLTVFFVIALYNTYSELVQSRRDADVQRKKWEADNAHLSAIIDRERSELSQLQDSYNSLSTQSKSSISSLTEDRDHFKSEYDKSVEQNRLGDIEIQELGETIDKQRNENAELLERLAHTAIGFRSINSVLGNVIANKSTVLKTYAFNFKDYAEDGIKLSGIEFADSIAQYLGFNADHIFGLTKTSSPENDSFATSRLNEVREDLLSRDGLISPVYYAQVIYIRSLDLKIVLTDFVANPLLVSDENREALKEFFKWIDSPSVIRSSSNTLVIDRNVWNAMEDNQADSFITKTADKSLYELVGRLRNTGNTQPESNPTL